MKPKKNTVFHSQTMVDCAVIMKLFVTSWLLSECIGRTEKARCFLVEYAKSKYLFCFSLNLNLLFVTNFSVSCGWITYLTRNWKRSWLLFINVWIQRHFVLVNMRTLCFNDSINCKIGTIVANHKNYLLVLLFKAAQFSKVTFID